MIITQPFAVLPAPLLTPEIGATAVRAADTDSFPWILVSTMSASAPLNAVIPSSFV